MPAISVENLGKAYQLRHQTSRSGYRTLRESFVDTLTNVWRRNGQRTNESTREEFWAIRELSFQIQPGEVVGIIGRNGAGKSTLLKVLSRITKPSTGRCVINGRVGSLLEVGTGFHPELTGRENIFMNGSILGMSHREIKRNFDAIVDFAEVEKFLDTPVKRYSSGMYVRLAFAVAAYLEPEILIIDEVLAVGDAEFQAKCLGKMGSVAREGRTILFVSHNMPAVTNLCTRAIWLQQGRVHLDGDVPNVSTAYLLSSSKATESDLSVRIDRSGDGSIKVEKISFVDSGDYEKKAAVVVGKPIAIRLDYSAFAEITASRIQVTVVIRDSFEKQLFSVATFFEPLPNITLPKRGSLVCSIARFPLCADMYSLDVHITNNGTVSDYIIHAADFCVDNTQVFSSSRTPSSTKHGPFIVSHEWEAIKT